MTYVEGFVVAVPTANKDAYRKHAAECGAAFPGFRRQRAWSRPGATTSSAAR